MGYSIDAFNVLLDRFENKYKMILFSRETNEVAILNFLRHSVMKGGKPVEDCIRKEMTLVKNKALIDFVFSRLYGRDDLNETVKKIVDGYIKENDIHNDNDNENERTGDDSFHDSPPIRPEPPEPPEPPKKPRKKKSDEVRHQYGEYKNVLLSDNDLEKLKSEFPDWENRIERLSVYMKSTGKTYADHLATIRNWARRDSQEAKKNQQNPRPQQQASQKKNEYNSFMEQLAAMRE